MGKYDEIQGLTDAQVIRSRSEHGTNELNPPEIEGFWEKLKENFEDPLIKILLVALVVTLVLSFFGYADWVEGIGIAVAVFLATFVSTYSEYKNERSFEALREDASKITIKVFRNGGTVREILMNDIVVGDFILLQAGDKIPADGKMIHGELHVIQAQLNGEPDPIKKIPPPEGYVPPVESDFLDQYLLFGGSTVEEGEGILRVEKVGKSTVLGTLAEELSLKDDRPSPLQHKLSVLADHISTFGYFGASFIAISFLFKQFVMDPGYNLPATIEYLSNWQVAFKDVITALILGIIVIVVAVPEGLPMMIAIVLSLNMRKLLKAQVLVRKLLGIETAGSLNVLLADKTGTITKGTFHPRFFLTSDAKRFSTFTQLSLPIQQILAFVLRESSSVIVNKENLVAGNASDRALVSFLTHDFLHDKAHITTEKEVLFTSAHKFSGVQVVLHPESYDKLPENIRTFTQNNLSLVKGAPEIVLENVKHIINSDGSISDNSELTSLKEQIHELAIGGIRFIGVAFTKTPLEDHQLPDDLVLVGVVGLQDEVREKSSEAVKLAHSAGIHVVMVTGDRLETAMGIARQIGLVEPHESQSEVSITSTKLQKLSNSELEELFPKLKVVARALPSDKSRLVRHCKSKGLVVGMTGDGVNDSSALKTADVGFAMGSGSEVAKEASDIVILNDDIFSIMQAVLYGRTIFKSIRKFIVFQCTINVSSLMTVFLGPFMGFDFPLTLIQLLWVNMVMDTLAALAFGGEVADPEYMKESPINRDDEIITPVMWSQILINGCFISFLSVVFLTYDLVSEFFVRDGKPDNEVFLTAFFCFFIFITVINAFNVRTTTTNLLHGLFDDEGFVPIIVFIFIVQITFTYIGGSVLRTVGLTTNEWLLILGVSLIIIPFDLLRKVLLAPLLKEKVSHSKKTD